MKEQGTRASSRGLIKSPRQIEGIRRSGLVNTAVLDAVQEHIKVGMTTAQIDQLVMEKTRQLGGVPAQLGYQGFPKSVCTSRNEEVCHGIPSQDVVLCDGDIVNVDASTILEGYYSDSSRMFCIGAVSPEVERLVRVTAECVRIGLEQVKPGAFLGDMAQAVREHAEGNGYSVVREIGGHGIGLDFHEEPWVGFVGKKGTGMRLAPGMVFTIEPMVNQGGARVITDPENGWTVRTADGGLSAQWEVMVLVTDTGYEVLAR